ncbi:carboxymuconolactone decarboxylase family protein [Actinoallomurus sp. NBC_01490]|uniref:carboxymuconolactone decarboxylase family protein n=1 Tax=Actinoallomurus sp. NBC_01490 TaxID=2903557 RepID=UPI002E366D36|nr:carboxymuconolactone decarboxylase family protein [Actinoallomurus sp. NBC_01490]
MTHGRVPWYDPAALDPERRAVHDEIAGGPRAAGPQAFRLTDARGRLEGPFNAMLTAPGVGGPLQRLGSAIRYATDLPARWREIAILEVAVVRRSDFEWYAHERVGRAAGLTDEELAALRSGGEAPSLSSAERTVRCVCRALLSLRDLDDELYERATADLGLERLYELLVLVGYYDLLALSLRTFRTPLPAGEPPIFA